MFSDLHDRYAASRSPSGACLAVGFLILVLLQACAGWRPGYESPTVTVSSFRTLPSQGLFPDFEIGLHVINPNREALRLVGVAYTISLAGHELVKGVGNDLPVIEGYGEGEFKLRASANLLAGAGLLRDMMATPGDTVSYEFEAKLDPGGLARSLRIRDAGEVSLTGSSSF